MSQLNSIGKNLQNARKALDITQDEVSSALGISRSAISLIESGQRNINSIELARFANLYHKTISEFLDPEPTPNGFEILFRTERISKEDRAKIIEFEDLCKRYSDLEKRLYGRTDWNNIPIYKHPDSYLDMERLATDERRRLDLGNAPIRDIFSLLESQGIRLFKLALESEISGGFTHSEEIGSCILLNVNHGIKMVFTAAHEYCHCLINRDVIATICRENYGRKKPPKESMANHFAGCFLMPREHVIECYDRAVGNGHRAIETDVILLSRYFGVSYDAMLSRLKYIKLITDSEYDELKKTRPSKIAEDNELIPVNLNSRKMPLRYINMALKLYLQEEISIGKLAEYLKVSIIETQKLVGFMNVEEVFEFV
jgi:Zn-dependent peptidase ImmA (M78 family)